MRSKQGFTLIELVIALAIAGLLASLAWSGYESRIQATNFNLMREAASKLALKQQQHRQTFGQYASQVASSGNASVSTLIFPEHQSFQTTILSADFRSFSASLRPKGATLNLRKECQTVIVQSQQGYLSFKSIDLEKNDSSEKCLPRG